MGVQNIRNLFEQLNSKMTQIFPNMAIENVKIRKCYDIFRKLENDHRKRLQMDQFLSEATSDMDNFETNDPAEGVQKDDNMAESEKIQTPWEYTISYKTYHITISYQKLCSCISKLLDTLSKWLYILVTAFINSLYSIVCILVKWLYTTLYYLLNNPQLFVTILDFLIKIFTFVTEVIQFLVPKMFSILTKCFDYLTRFFYFFLNCCYNIVELLYQILSKCYNYLSILFCLPVKIVKLFCCKKVLLSFLFLI